MSELTRCNYCALQSMTIRAEERGASITISKDEYDWITVTYSDKQEPSAYFMELTESCVC